MVLEDRLNKGNNSDINNQNNQKNQNGSGIIIENDCIDNLTQILNRDGMDKHYNHLADTYFKAFLLAEYSGNSTYLSNDIIKDFAICMIDIDHFKRINDAYGHLVGDDVLKKISSRLCEILNVDQGTAISHGRRSNSIGRHGGEEFVITLGNMNKIGAYTLLLDIKQNLNVSYDNFNKKIKLSSGAAYGNFFENNKRIKDDFEQFLQNCSMESINLEILEEQIDIYININIPRGEKLTSYGEIKQKIFSETLVQADRGVYFSKMFGRDKAVFYDDNIKEIWDRYELALKMMDYIKIHSDMVFDQVMGKSLVDKSDSYYNFLISEIQKEINRDIKWINRSYVAKKLMNKIKLIPIRIKNCFRKDLTETDIQKLQLYHNQPWEQESQINNQRKETYALMFVKSMLSPLPGFANLTNSSKDAIQKLIISTYASGEAAQSFIKGSNENPNLIEEYNQNCLKPNTNLIENQNGLTDTLKWSINERSNPFINSCLNAYNIN